MEDKKALRNLIYTVLTLLVSGNLFFIKRLVDKLENVENMMWQQRQEITLLSYRMDISCKQKTNK